MSEQQGSVEDFQRMLGFTPKQQAEDVHVQVEPTVGHDRQSAGAPEPEPDVPEISDTNDNVNEELRRALEQSEQRDANLWAAGIPPARTLAQQRADDLAFLTMLHPPNTDDAA